MPHRSRGEGYSFGKDLWVAARSLVRDLKRSASGPTDTCEKGKLETWMSQPWVCHPTPKQKPLINKKGEKKKSRFAQKLRNEREAVKLTKTHGPPLSRVLIGKLCAKDFPSFFELTCLHEARWKFPAECEAQRSEARSREAGAEDA